jgi:hypothetical protein
MPKLLVTQAGTGEVGTGRGKNGTLCVIETIYAQLYGYVHWGCRVYVKMN